MNLKSFYTSTFLRSLAEALISPFISIFALLLGATKALIGLASTLPTLANLFSQLFWGNLSESTGKKSVLIIFGGIAWALMWIPIALVKDPLQFVFLLSIQSLLSAASVPAWTVLLIQVMPSYKRAYITGNLNLISNAGALIGTLLGGLVLNMFGFIPFLFYVIAFLGIMSRLPFFWTKEPTTYHYNDKNLLNILRRTFDFSIIRREKEILKLIIAITYLNFSVMLAAPFLSIYVVTGLNGNMMNIAIISAIGVVSAITFYRPWGTIIDRGGKKFVMLACIAPISFIPFVYSLANNITWLYLYEIVGTMSWAGFNLAAFSYLADVLPKERASSSIAIYNLLVGLGSAAGPFVGGMLADMIGFKHLFILSMIMRFLTIIFLERIEEKTDLKKVSVSRSRFGYLSLAHGIENFISTYSLVIDETLKQSIKLLDVKNHLRKRRLLRLR
jgi:MFS family permease